MPIASTGIAEKLSPAGSLPLSMNYQSFYLISLPDSQPSYIAAQHPKTKYFKRQKLEAVGLLRLHLGYWHPHSSAILSQGSHDPFSSHQNEGAGDRSFLSIIGILKYVSIFNLSLYLLPFSLSLLSSPSICCCFCFHLHHPKMTVLRIFISVFVLGETKLREGLLYLAKRRILVDSIFLIFEIP